MRVIGSPARVRWFRRAWPAMGMVMAIALGSLVGSSAVAPPAHAIEGGQVVTEDVPWVVDVTPRSSTGKGLGGCTGTLISPTYVLTAGHCLGAPAVSATVYVFRNVGVPRAYFSKRMVRSDINDVGLIELDNPVTDVTPQKISTLSEDSSAIMYGVGKTGVDGKPQSQSSFPFKKSSVQSLVGEMPSLAIGASWEGLGNGFYKGLLFGRTIIGRSDSGHALPGDSGGPLMQHGAVVAVISAGSPLTSILFRLGVSSKSGTTLFASLASVHDWILSETKLTDADVSADYPTTTIRNVDILGTGRATWLQSVQQSDGSYAAKFVTGGNQATFDLLFDMTGAFQIRDSAGRCLTLNARPYVTDLGLNAFSNKTVFGACNYSDAKQKFALRNPVSSTPQRMAYSIASSTTKLSLVASGSEVQASTSTADSMTIQSESANDVATLAGYATQRASTPDRGKRQAAQSTVSMTLSSGVTTTLPALPAGVHPVALQTAAQDGSAFVYVLGDDARLYKTSWKSPKDQSFNPWEVRPQTGITQVAAATSGSAGAIYTDGASVYATYGGKFPDLPDATSVSQIAMTMESGKAYMYVLGSNGVLYRSTDTGWSVIDRQVSAMTPSETDGAVAYVVNGGARYSSPSRSAILPALPAAAGIADFRLSSQGGDSFAYVVGLDGKVYKSAAAGRTGGFGAWAAQEGDGVVGLRTATVTGGAVYTNGQTVYSTFGGAASFPALPSGVTADGVALGDEPGGKDYAYVLSTDGVVYRNVLGEGAWTPISPTTSVVDSLSVSQSNGSVIYTSHPR